MCCCRLLYYLFVPFPLHKNPYHESDGTRILRYTMENADSERVSDISKNELSVQNVDNYITSV